MYYITVSNGLLEGKHRQKMQANQKTSCIWIYLWLLDKITKIDLETGLGKVLGGKPIKLHELREFGDRKTVIAILKKLEFEGYIKTQRTPYGKIICVTKAKKSFGWQPSTKRNGESGTSEIEQNIKNLVHLDQESGTSNKTIQYDNEQIDNTTNVVSAKLKVHQDYKIISSLLEELKSILEINKWGAQSSWNRRFANLALKEHSREDIIEGTKWLLNNWPHKPLTMKTIFYGLRQWKERSKKPSILISKSVLNAKTLPHK